jgi:hypothetical protein
MSDKHTLYICTPGTGSSDYYTFKKSLYKIIKPYNEVKHQFFSSGGFCGGGEHLIQFSKEFMNGELYRNIVELTETRYEYKIVHIDNWEQGVAKIERKGM